MAEALVKRVSSLPKPSPVLEECSMLVAGDIEILAPSKCYLHRISFGERLSISPELTTIPSIEGGLWIDYIKRYGESLRRRLKILLIERSRYKIYIIDASKPYSPLVLSQSPMGFEDTVVVLEMPGRGSSVFEKSSSYASYEIARRRAGSIILIDRDRLSNLYGFDGNRVLKYRRLETKIIEIILGSLGRVASFMSVNKRIGVRSYIVAALIGASTSVYGDVYNSFRILNRCSSWAFTDLSAIYRASSVLVIARAPKNIYEEILASYTKYLGNFQEVLSHEGVYVEYDSRLRLYDIVALLGFPEIPPPDHIVQGHRSLETMNPELRVDEVIQWP